MDNILEHLSEADKDRIFEIYQKAYKVNIPEGKRISVLITDYLYGNALLPDEAAQIAVYHKIIQEYMNDVDIVLIKPHPRDPVNYENFTSNSIVLASAVSAEILNLSSKLSFEKAITVTSTSIHSFVKAKERIILGKEYVQKLQVN